MNGFGIIITALLYVGILFGIAWYGDQQARRGRLTNNPYIYALSLAVYCTAWTFYGSVGRAAQTGVGFLPIYLGPTLMAFLWITVLRKIVRISKVNRITTIADFIGARYGKSSLLAGIVAMIAVIGVIPYLSLQLKAVATSFDALWAGTTAATTPITSNTAFVVAMLLALFAILFGTRNLDVTEHHEGLVLSIAFESIIKLISFLSVGIFVTFFLFDGFGAVFETADNSHLITLNTTYGDWMWLIVLSMLAVILLPRQFQMAVVENVDENHLFKAVWLFPLYLLLINIFVLPIAFAGNALLPHADADFYVLTLPLSQGRTLLALFAFVGGFSAATGMVIVSTVALSTMVSNDLVMPILIRWERLGMEKRSDWTGLLLTIRRVAIIGIILLAYLYFTLARDESLVSIGLISFAAVAQFAPALIGGIFWKRGNRQGALTGLIIGFLLWAYTLPLPSLVTVGGILPDAFITRGLFGQGILKPYNLFGIGIADPLTHSLMWSVLFNIGCYITVSLMTPQNILDQAQATRFVDVFRASPELERLDAWGNTTKASTLGELLRRFLGEERVNVAFKAWQLSENDYVYSQTVNRAEKLLAGAIGAASAHIVLGTIVNRNPLTMLEVMDILDESRRAIRANQRLEQKSQELAEMTAELRQANTRLRELDDMKNEFVSHVSHELRTPLTSIRAFTEILHDNRDLNEAQQVEFLDIIMHESERLTRLINNMLDLSKIESGAAEWLLSNVDLGQLVAEAVAVTSQLFHDNKITLTVTLPAYLPEIIVDRDRIMQVLVNLLSNASKYGRTQAELAVTQSADFIIVSVKDDGVGIDAADFDAVFERFKRLRTPNEGNPTGTGLGLPISRHIINHFGGQLWLESEIGMGATFYFTLPRALEVRMEVRMEVAIS